MLASFELTIHESEVDSGLVEATGTGGPHLIWNDTITVSGVSALRLHFDTVQLAGSESSGNASYVRIYSPADSAVQILTAKTFEKWENTSAYFNGDEVEVELYAYAGTGENRIVVDSVIVEAHDCQSFGTTGFCNGVDDRFLSDDPRAARIRFLEQRVNPSDECIARYCSAFLVHPYSNGFLAVGHCCKYLFPLECPFPSVVEFNVFPSNQSTGEPVASYPVDQFPIDRDSVVLLNTSPPNNDGLDWCFFGVRRNENDETPLMRQHAWYTLAQTADVPQGSSLRITGFEVDSDPPGTGLPECYGVENLTQQTGTGPFVDLDGTILSFKVDASPSSSGSPIEHICGKVIGVFTDGGCNQSAGVNLGTAIDEEGLQDALADPQGVLLDCNENGIPDACDIDCGEAEGPCDVAGCGESDDCNGNGVPDDCESFRDCNNNQVRDICESPLIDCNHNGVPDECDIASGFSKDCNENDIPDECDICSELESDCNNNWIPDSCDIAAGTSLDCNENGVPDECETSQLIKGACCVSATECVNVTSCACEVLDGGYYGDFSKCATTNCLIPAENLGSGEEE